MVSRGRNDSRPRYHHHRGIDDAKGVVTAVETTPRSVTENRKLLDLIDQHEKNTDTKVEKVVGDHKYGTQENFVGCQQRGISTHLGDAVKGQDHHQAAGILPESAFVYDPARDTYRCPAGELLRSRRVHPVRHTMEYKARAGACAACALRPQCTRAKFGRTLHRHKNQALLDVAKAQAHSQRGPTRSQAPTAVNGTKFCRCHQQSSLQTHPLAKTLAPTDPGLLDRRHPERAHPSGPSKSQQKCGSGTIFINPSGSDADFAALRNHWPRSIPTRILCRLNNLNTVCSLTSPNEAFGQQGL